MEEDSSILVTVETDINSYAYFMDRIMTYILDQILQTSMFKK